jgi:hypothetical protein
MQSHTSTSGMHTHDSPKPLRCNASTAAASRLSPPVGTSVICSCLEPAAPAEPTYFTIIIIIIIAYLLKMGTRSCRLQRPGSIKTSYASSAASGTALNKHARYTNCRNQRASFGSCTASTCNVSQCSLLPATQDAHCCFTAYRHVHIPNARSVQSMFNATV